MLSGLTPRPLSILSCPISTSHSLCLFLYPTFNPIPRSGEQGKKKHVCHIPDCGKTFRKTSLLRAHVRLHTGERPFVCNWFFCGKRFTRSDKLQRHARTHTGDKRFECAQCQKRFMRSDHLTKHYKTHLVTKNL